MILTPLGPFYPYPPEVGLNPVKTIFHTIFIHFYNLIMLYYYETYNTNIRIHVGLAMKLNNIFCRILGIFGDFWRFLRFLGLRGRFHIFDRERLKNRYFELKF